MREKTSDDEEGALCLEKIRAIMIIIKPSSWTLKILLEMMNSQCLDTFLKKIKRFHHLHKLDLGHHHQMGV